LSDIVAGLFSQAVIAYAVSYAVTYIATGSGKAAQGAGLPAGLFMGIGGLRGGKVGADGKMHYNPGWEPGSMKTLVAHGLAGGIVQDRMGGSFGAGFLAGSAGSYFGSSGKSGKANEIIGNTAIEAVIGGAISVVGGGKFANGAQTGAFRYLFNENMRHGRTFGNSLKFKTQHDAAFYALRINSTSISENREHGGLIYRNSDGSYSFTGPIAGKEASVDPRNAPAPNGANVTAYYHTHGAYDPKYNSEYFSTNGDIPYAKRNEMDGYLATPMGKIKYYNYTNDVIKVLQ